MTSARLRAIGIDIGVTNTKTVCVLESSDKANAQRILTQSTLTHAEDATWTTGIRDVVNELEAQHGPTQSIGIAAPGIADPSGTQIAWMQGRLMEVQHLNWTTFLDRAKPVPVLNDAQAALLGEVWKGAAQDQANVIMLTLGTGVGGAAMVDGRLLRGHLGRAGHLGHICLDMQGPADIVNTPGSLEYFVGNYSLRERQACPFASTLELARAYEAGNPQAHKHWSNLIRALACGIASLINVLDPESVVIGGGIATAGKTLFKPLARELDKVEWRPHNNQVRIVPARLGEYAGAYGAAWNAMQQEST
ncbi:MAG TPA: ROK family protein [Tepidisphaeraceae bacterium]